MGGRGTYPPRTKIVPEKARTKGTWSFLGWEATAAVLGGWGRRQLEGPVPRGVLQGAPHYISGCFSGLTHYISGCLPGLTHYIPGSLSRLTYNILGYI